MTGGDSLSLPSHPPSDFAYKRIDDHFEILSQIGEGTYGKVFKARHKKSARIVALKMIRFETETEGFPLTALREIRALTKLSTLPQIAHFLEVVTSETSVFLVFEYYPWDLAAFLSQMGAAAKTCSTPVVGCAAATTISDLGSNGSSPVHLPQKPDFVSALKAILKQVLEIIGELHARNILHRDIKASNILIGADGVVCLADFGLSRLLSSEDLSSTFAVAMKGLMTSRVVTLWYRSPELLLGCTDYSCAVDMWSVGCLMGELFTRKAPFVGSDEVSQLEAIFDSLPYHQETVEKWPLAHLFKWAKNSADCECDPVQTLSPFYTSMTACGWELFLELLSVNPTERPTASEALKHPFFTQEFPLPCSNADLQNILLSFPNELHEFEVKSQRKKRHLASQTLAA